MQVSTIPSTRRFELSIGFIISNFNNAPPRRESVNGATRRLRPARLEVPMARVTAAGNLVAPQMLSDAVLAYLAVHPPSMRIVSPVIRDAAREARNTTTPATSIG